MLIRMLQYFQTNDTIVAVEGWKGATYFTLPWGGLLPAQVKHWPKKKPHKCVTVVVKEGGESPKSCCLIARLILT